MVLLPLTWLLLWGSLGSRARQGPQTMTSPNHSLSRATKRLTSQSKRTWFLIDLIVLGPDWSAAKSAKMGVLVSCLGIASFAYPLCDKPKVHEWPKVPSPLDGEQWRCPWEGLHHDIPRPHHGILPKVSHGMGSTYIIYIIYNILYLYIIKYTI
jgi:hypothetical protein